MKTLSRPLPSVVARLSLAALMTLALLGLPAASLAQQPSTGSGEPVCPPPCDVVQPSWADGATPIEPDPAVIDPRPSAWDHVVVSADGRTLSVYFYMGIEECYGLHSVEITPAAGGIDVLVMTGLQPDAASRVCIEIAQLYVTTVTLDAPLIGNQY